MDVVGMMESLLGQSSLRHLAYLAITITFKHHIFIRAVQFFMAFQLSMLIRVQRLNANALKEPLPILLQRRTRRLSFTRDYSKVFTPN